MTLSNTIFSFKPKAYFYFTSGRFNRGLKTLQGLLKDAEAGKPIKLEDIPPPVMVGNAADKAQPAASIPEEPQPPPAAEVPPAEAEQPLIDLGPPEPPQPEPTPPEPDTSKGIASGNGNAKRYQELQLILGTF